MVAQKAALYSTSDCSLRYLHMHVMDSRMCGKMQSAHSQHYSAREGTETVAHSSHYYGSVALSSIQSTLHLTHAHYVLLIFIKVNDANQWYAT